MLGDRRKELKRAQRGTASRRFLRLLSVSFLDRSDELRFTNPGKQLLLPECLWHPSGARRGRGRYPGLRCDDPGLPMWASFGSKRGAVQSAAREARFKRAVGGGGSGVARLKPGANKNSGTNSGGGKGAAKGGGVCYRRPAGCRRSFRRCDGERSVGILPAWEGLPQAGRMPAPLSAPQVPRGCLSIRLTVPCA